MIAPKLPPARHARLFELIRQSNLAEECRARLAARAAQAADVAIAEGAARSLTA